MFKKKSSAEGPAEDARKPRIRRTAGKTVNVKLPVLPIIIALVLAALILVAYFAGWFKKPKGGEVTTVTTSSLEKILEISELSTVEYTYNAVTKHCLEDGTIVYYVAYDGQVKAGIDFEKIEISVDEAAKKITVILPEVRIQGCRVDVGTLDFIFMKKEYNIASVSADAYKLCQADLEKKAAAEPKLLELARENAIQAVEALIEPWVQQVDAGYTLEVK